VSFCSLSLIGLAFCFSPAFLYAIERGLVVPRLCQCFQSLRFAYIACVSPKLGRESIDILLGNGWTSVFVVWHCVFGGTRQS
jgi:hypothetical protein